MTARAVTSSSTPRPSARVETVCGMLECDRSQVYRLVADGEIEAHGIGKRGVRVYLDSVQAYQERRFIVPKTAKARRKIPSPARPSPASRAAHADAVAQLRDLGLL